MGQQSDRGRVMWAMDAADFERVYRAAFGEFHSFFAPLFGRREARDLSRRYLQGLLVQSAERRNAENLSESVGVSSRSMQRFLSEAPWDDDLVMGRLQEYPGSRLEHPDAVWVLDGSDFPKQGRKSAGVARQYCGPLGKVSNCQAEMLLACTSPLGRPLVDKRLYLPESWTQDPERCAATGVPKERRIYRSKTELALEMLEQAVALGHLRAGWVAADDALGVSPSFREDLAALGMRYVLDVPAGFNVWPAEPEWNSPPCQGRGAPCKPRLRAGQQRTMEQRAASVPVGGLAGDHCGPGGQGPRTYRFAVQRVQVPPAGASPAMRPGPSTAGTWTAANPATTCPTPLRTLPWRPWRMWAGQDGE